jgi:hypothetical protein
MSLSLGMSERTRPLARAPRGLADALRVARFARGARSFRVRPDDIFISSYPRSGTTWLQYLLHVLIHRADTGFTHVSQVAPWYERSLSLGRMRADDFERFASPRLFKSHLPHAWLPRGARYIYARRAGRDVLVSYYHLYCSHLGWDAGFAAFFERFLRGELQYGSWFDHVAAWEQAAREDPAVCVVDYEALSRDLQTEMARLCAFLGLVRDPGELLALSRVCSFEAMRRDEARFDHATDPQASLAAPRGAFVRRGVSGAHDELLTPAQSERFEHALREPRRPPKLRALPLFLL